MSNTPPHAINAFEWLARIDPAFDDARRHLARLVSAPAAPALAVKYREIIAAVILGCRSYPTIELHLRRALAAGATLREVLEGFQVAAILGGFPALHYALPFMMALHEEFGDTILDGPDGNVNGKGKQSALPPKTTGAAASAAINPVSRGMREWAWLDAVDPAY